MRRNSCCKAYCICKWKQCSWDQPLSLNWFWSLRLVGSCLQDSVFQWYVWRDTCSTCFWMKVFLAILLQMGLAEEEKLNCSFFFLYCCYFFLKLSTYRHSTRKLNLGKMWEKEGKKEGFHKLKEVWKYLCCILVFFVSFWLCLSCGTSGTGPTNFAGVYL